MWRKCVVLNPVILWAVIFCVTVVCFQKPFSPEYPRLRQYNVDRRLVSVSGLSNGAAISSNLAFIHSSLISAAGIFAGGSFPFPHFLYSGTALNVFKAHNFYPIIDRWSAQGLIDPVTNLRRTRVYAFQGSLDLVVPKNFMFDVVKIFNHYGSAVKSSIHQIPTHHCIPTDNFPPKGDYIPVFGTAGGTCNAGYQGINHMFHHFYGRGFVWPQRNNATPTGQLFKFDQNEFFKNNYAEGALINNAGSIYVPRGCHSGHVQCKLHLAFHGFQQNLISRLLLDGHNEFIQNGGYLQAADANNIIMIFPEATTLGFAFDIIGWTGKSFLWKNGTHPMALGRMIRRVVYGQ